MLSIMKGEGEFSPLGRPPLGDANFFQNGMSHSRKDPPQLVVHHFFSGEAGASSSESPQNFHIEHLLQSLCHHWLVLFLPRIVNSPHLNGVPAHQRWPSLGLMNGNCARKLHGIELQTSCNPHAKYSWWWGGLLIH